MSKQLSRREFMRNAGLAGTGLALAACAPVAQDGAMDDGSMMAEKETAYIFDYDPTGTDAWVEADQQFIDYFTEKYPDYEIIREQAPWAGFTEKLLTSIAGGSEYDVIYGYWQWLPLFIENNVIGPLDDLIDSDTEISADDFFDYAKETIEGETYGLAWFISGWLHWYNLSAVNEAGATTPKEMNENGDWDYDAWYQFAKEFTSEQDGVPIYGYEMGSGRSVSVYVMLAWAWGTEQWNDDFSASIMDNEENVALWKWIQQFYLEGLTPPARLQHDRAADQLYERPLHGHHGRPVVHAHDRPGRRARSLRHRHGALPHGAERTVLRRRAQLFLLFQQPRQRRSGLGLVQGALLLRSRSQHLCQDRRRPLPVDQARRAGHRLRMGGYGGLRGDPPDSAHLSHEPQRVRVDQHVLERGLGRDGSGNTPHRGDPRAARRRVDRPRELVTAIPGGQSFPRRLAADYHPLTAHHLPRAANCRLPTTDH